MTDLPDVQPDSAAADGSGPHGSEPRGEGAGGVTAAADATDVAAENRRRMREALDRKRGVAHPDDTAQGGPGAHGPAPGSAKRDFSRRRSG